LESLKRECSLKGLVNNTKRGLAGSRLRLFFQFGHFVDDDFVVNTGVIIPDLVDDFVRGLTICDSLGLD
jgi:hypothetical protein